MSGTTKGQAYSKPMHGSGKSEPGPDLIYPAGTVKMAKNVQKMKNLEWKHRFTLPYWKAAWHYRGVSTAIFFVCGASSIMVAMPYIVQQYREILGFDLTIHDSNERLMPSHSPAWWLNEWRKSLTPWRNGESWHELSKFYVRSFAWIKRHTGQDLLKPTTNNNNSEATKTSTSSIHGGEHNEQLPRVLVPMCGDTPIIKTLLNAGYEVDCVDSADFAIRELADRLDFAFVAKPDLLQNCHLHLQDIFSPFAWKDETGVQDAHHAFDFIWDRQGLSAVDPLRRDDYAFLLKRALKPDTGIIYTEGCYRTTKRKGNRDIGPPFHFGTEDLQDLFPRSQGFRAKCDDMEELTMEDLDAESKVTGIIPEHLLGRHFPCVVWKDKALLKEIAMAG